MKQIPNIIKGEYLVFESSEYLKKAQYIRCFKLIENYIADPFLIKDSIQDLQIQIQLTRRLIHCSNQLLKKYFRKINDKSHKLQPLIHRTIELCLILADDLSYYYRTSRSKKISRSETPQLVCESPTIKRRQFYRQISQEKISLKNKLMQFSQHDLSEQFELKSDAWFQNQCYTFYLLLQSTLINTFRYHKYNRTQYAIIFLHLANKLNNNKYEGIKQQQIKSNLSNLLGNCYFEIQEFQLAELYYQQSIDLASVSIYKLLDDIEKLRKNVDEPLLKVQITQLSCNVQISLNLIGYINVQEENYHRCLETYGVAQFINRILGFFSSKQEIINVIDQANISSKEHYQDHIKEVVEIAKLLSSIYNIPIKLPDVSNLDIDNQMTLNEFYELLAYNKMRKTGVTNDNVIVTQAQLPPKAKMRIKQSQSQSDIPESYYIQSAQKLQKIIRVKHNNSSMHSLDQPSTNYADSQLQLSNKMEFSLSKLESPKRSLIIRKGEAKLRQGIRKDSQHRNSFLNDLIGLRNEYLSKEKPEVEHDDQLEKVYQEKKKILMKITNKNVYQPLDKVVSSYIDHNLEQHQRCTSLDEVKQKAQHIVQAELEVHKEVPTTKNLLNALKVTCSTGVFVKEDVKEFNKLFEFNALEYFDFVSTQKDQVITCIKERQESDQVRMASQNLFSENFVPKKKLHFKDEDDTQKLLEAHRIQAQAEEMLVNANKRKDRRKSTRAVTNKFAILNYKDILQKKSSLLESPKPINPEEALQSAQATIKQYLNANEQQRKDYELEDEELKETELPFKFKRSRSTGQKRKNQVLKGILHSHQPDLLQLCSTTKGIREKSFASNITDSRMKLWVDKKKS